LIVNAKSRQGSESFDQAVDLLGRAGVELIDARPVKNPKRMAQEVKEAIDRAPMVIVGGGDGTLSSTIDFFKGKKTVFAVLPLGTANSFARAAGLPLDIQGAVDVIANGRQRQIDLGCINGDYFGNSAAIGLSPLIAKTVPPRLKKVLGRLGYALWAAKVGIRFRPFRLTIAGDDSSATVWATEVRIANGGFFGGVELVEEAELDSGEIIVQVVTGKTSRSLAKNWISNMLKLRDRDEWQAEIRARRVRLETDPVMDVTIDGELATRTPLEVSIAPKAVAIAAPKPR
jgi:YegS/Rv2252/BmrU family lipid kinase